MKLLEGQVALITGGSRGIGRAIAECFAQQGASVAFTCTTITESVNELVKQLESYGKKAKVYTADAADFDSAHKIAEDIISQFGSIDVLVNNAGITQDSLLLRMTEEQWDQVITTNLKSAFNYTKACQRQMLKQKSGSIINVSSVVGVNGNAGQVNYAASKAGLIGFSRSVAKELGGKKIRCNVVAPGFIHTEMTENLPDKVKEYWLSKIPMGRFGDVEEVAKSVLFLASDLSTYVTGQILHVCGAINI